MFVKVKYFGLPVARLSSNTQQIEIPDSATVGQLLDYIIAMLDNRDKDMLNSAVILVNKAKAQKHTVLRENDEVMIMRALGGG